MRRYYLVLYWLWTKFGNPTGKEEGTGGQGDWETRRLGDKGDKEDKGEINYQCPIPELRLSKKMAEITLQIPDELAQRLQPLQQQLPELGNW